MLLQITEIYADKLKSSNKTSNLGFSLPVHDNYYMWKKKKKKTEQEDHFFFLTIIFNSIKKKRR